MFLKHKQIEPGKSPTRAAFGLYFSVYLGRWKLTSDGLYRWTEHRDAKTNGRKGRWFMWDRVRLRDIIQTGKTVS